MEVQGPSPQLIKIVTLIYRFPLPATKHIDFAKCFARCLGQPDTAKEVAHMDGARRELAEELATGQPNYANVVNAAQRYIPLIAQTLYSLEQAQSPVYLSEQLKFEWATGIGINPRRNWITSEAVVWDKCMAMAAQAMAHANNWFNMVTAGPERYNSGAEELCRAAGVMIQLSKEELPRWIGKTADGERLPEAIEGIVEGLSIVCLAQAQQLAVAKAIESGRTPPGLIAKLCFGVTQLMDQGLSVLRTKGSVVFAKLDRPLLVHMALMQQVFKAVGLQHMAALHWSKDEYGTAIAFSRKAQAALAPRASDTSEGVPPAAALGNMLAMDISALRDQATATLNAYEKDNRTIYYCPVPATTDPLPEPVIMMKPRPYEVPTMRIMLFQEVGAPQPPPPPIDHAKSSGDAIPPPMAPAGGGSGASSAYAPPPPTSQNQTPETYNPSHTMNSSAMLGGGIPSAPPRFP